MSNRRQIDKEKCEFFAALKKNEIGLFAKKKVNVTRDYYIR